MAVLFFGVIVFASIPMGANRDWAWAPIVIAIALLGLVMACGLGTRSGFDVAPAERKPLFVLIGLFGLFVLIALIQMSTWMPSAGAWFYDTAGRLLGKAHATVPTLAVDAERNSLLKGLGCGAIFLMARALCRRNSRARLFLLMFVGSAVLVMVYGVIMEITTHSCYVGAYIKKEGGYVPLSDSCVMSGTFVNSNSFAAYLGMGLVAAIALIFAHRPRPQRVLHGYEEVEGVIASVTGFRLALLAVCLFLLSGTLIAASRAGFAATLVGVGVAVALLMRRRWRARPELRRIFFVALVLVLVVGVFASGALISKSMKTHDGGDRLDIWLASLHAVRESPWLGWGLGSFADIYTVLQPPALTLINDLAHSTPLEFAVELGIPGALVAFALVLLPWFVCLGGALRAQGPSRYLSVAAFAIPVVPILHSLVDFSLQMPAIEFVVSATLAMGWSRAFAAQGEGRRRFT
ncbi:MAG: O-antigen ligase family protein [Reyranellaceae bacterium]